MFSWCKFKTHFPVSTSSPHELARLSKANFIKTHAANQHHNKKNVSITMDHSQFSQASWSSDWACHGMPQSIQEIHCLSGTHELKSSKRCGKLLLIRSICAFHSEQHQLVDFSSTNEYDTSGWYESAWTYLANRSIGIFFRLVSCVLGNCKSSKTVVGATISKTASLLSRK